MGQVPLGLQRSFNALFLSLALQRVSFLHRCLSLRGWRLLRRPLFHSAYPPFIDPGSLTIASVEMLALKVSVKLLSEELRGQRILARTDNQNTELAINTGRFRVPFVRCGLRELWFYASLFDFEQRSLHIPGHENTVADSLSLWDNDPRRFRASFRDAASFYYDHLSGYFCSFVLFRFECQWQPPLRFVSGFHLSELQHHVLHIQASALSDATKRNLSLHLEFLSQVLSIS